MFGFGKTVKNRTKVLLIKNRANGLEWEFDYGVETLRYGDNDKKETELKLTKHNITLPVPDSKFKHFAKGRDVYPFYSPSEGTYYPVEIKIDEKNGKANFKPVNWDLRSWMVDRTRRTVIKWQKKTTLDKVLPILAIAVTGVVMAILLYVSISQLSGYMETLGGIVGPVSTVAVKIAEATEKITTALEVLAAQQPTPGPKF